MNFPIFVTWYFYAIICCEHFAVSDNSARLTSLNDSFFVLQLYLKLKTEDSTSSPTISTTHSDAQFREDICKDIADTGFFTYKHLLSNSVLYHSRNHPRYRDIFRQMYTSTNSQDFFVYTNTYRLREFAHSLFRFKEYLFVCPFVDWSNNVIPYYVSKEYNVGLSGGPHKPGRFLFGNDNIESTTPPNRYDHLILAEEPAIARTEPDFNVELYYLRMRKYIKPAEREAIDPLCKLIPRERENPNNQHHRLCVAVCRSSYFKDKLTYPRREPSMPCRVEKISFRTPEALEEAAGQSYYERMTWCYSEQEYRHGEREYFLYVSRAYRSNYIFVYRRVGFDGDLYLENLSANVSVEDELNSFDFVEY